MSTTAVRDGDSWVLNGRKIWISHATEADWTIVMALTDRSKGKRGGMSAFIVDRDTPGFVIERRIPMIGGLSTYEIVLENCRLPAAQLLGREGAGFAPMQARLANRRLEMAAWCIGRAERAVAMLCDHAKQRTTFGVPLAERQAVQWWVADALTQIHACRLMTYEAAARVDAGQDARTQISMVKVFATEMASSVIDHAMQTLGAMGMTKEMPLQQMASEARLMRIFEADRGTVGSSRAACCDRATHRHDGAMRWIPCISSILKSARCSRCRPSRSAPTTSQSRERVLPLPPPDLAGSTLEHRAVPGPAGAPDVPVLVYLPEAGARRSRRSSTCTAAAACGAAKDLEAVHRSLVTQLGCALISIDYRLAPETVFPGAIEDCYAALAWVFRHADALGIDAARIGVTGESAGGAAAALALLARDRGEYRLAFQHLIYPMLDDRTCTRASHPCRRVRLACGQQPFGWSALLGHAPGVDGVSPYAAAARATRLDGLPPAFLSVGSLDLFLDENLDYAQRLLRAGVPTELHVLPGGVHGFDIVPGARVSKRRAASATMHCAGSCTDDETTRAAEAARIRSTGYAQNASPGTRTAFHQHARTAAHDRLGDGPLAVLALRFRADAQRADGCPKRTALRSPPPAARLTSVPGIAAAVPIATAAVPIIAWCSLPIDIARTSRSTSPAFTRLPLDAT